MGLQEKIGIALKESMKAKNEARTSALRVVLGEFQRQAKKDLSDQEVQGIIRKLVKSENELLNKSGGGRSEYLEVLESYLPKQATEEEIREWIRQNINMADFKNKMQAMKPIMGNFGGTADGNMVRKILESL